MAKIEELEEIRKEIESETDAVEMSDPSLDVVEEEVLSIPGKVIDMTKIPEGEESTIIKIAKKEFNPQSTQNALEDEDDEAGVAAFRSTSGKYGSGKQGGIYNPKPEDTEGSIILDNFKAFVDEESIDVIAKFPDVETAKASINGDKFIFFNGTMKVATIIDGAPTISDDERELWKFINSEWIRP